MILKQSQSLSKTWLWQNCGLLGNLFRNEPRLHNDAFCNYLFDKTRLSQTQHFVIFQARAAWVKSLQPTSGAVPVVVVVAGLLITLHGEACADLPPVLAWVPWVVKMATILMTN